MGQFLTENQLQTLYSTLKPRSELLIRIAVETGATAAQLVEIRHSDVSKGSLQLPYGEMPISAELHTLIHSQPKKTEFLFSSRQSPQMSAKRAEQLIKDALGNFNTIEQATPHLLRYTFIHQQFLAKVRAQRVAQQLNYTTQRILQLYESWKQLSLPKINSIGSVLALLLSETGLSAREATELPRNCLKGDIIETPYGHRKLSPQLVRALKPTHQAATLLAGRQGSFSERRIHQLIKQATGKNPYEFTKQYFRDTIARQGLDQAAKTTGRSVGRLRTLEGHS